MFLIQYGVEDMYVCLDCDSLFEEPNTYYGETLEYFGAPCRECVSGCPSCGGYYQETFKCDQCGEYIVDKYVELSDGTKVCDNCYQVKNITDKDY